MANTPRVPSDGEVLDWSAHSTPICSGALQQGSIDSADMAGGGPQATFRSIQANSVMASNASGVGPLPGEQGLNANLPADLRGPTPDKYQGNQTSPSRLEKGMLDPLAANAHESFSSVDVRKKKRAQTFTATIALAVVVGVIVSLLVLLGSGPGPAALPLNEACARVECKGFNSTDETCRGALFSWCCSEVGGSVSCNFPEQRELAWGALLSECPPCKGGCLQDTFFESPEMFSSLGSCGLH